MSFQGNLSFLFIWFADCHHVSYNSSFTPSHGGSSTAGSLALSCNRYSISLTRRQKQTFVWLETVSQLKNKCYFSLHVASINILVFENYTTNSCGQFLFDAKFIVKKKLTKLTLIKSNFWWLRRMLMVFKIIFNVLFKSVKSRISPWIVQKQKSKNLIILCYLIFKYEFKQG